MGVEIAIDDFGTGYSSLSYLTRLPAHHLKIDRTFVRNLGDETRQAAVIRSTIELGHTLGLRVVAEGVEDEATRAFLSELGCDRAQGFQFGRPIPAHDVLRWCADHDVMPRALRAGGRSLEDVFLELTGHQMRQ
jgi:EAL domain-containing protein (putative c-di-GMP-specific phosphodiesterase class I)